MYLKLICHFAISIIILAAKAIITVQLRSAVIRAHDVRTRRGKDARLNDRTFIRTIPGICTHYILHKHCILAISRPVYLTCTYLNTRPDTSRTAVCYCFTTICRKSAYLISEMLAAAEQEKANQQQLQPLSEINPPLKKTYLPWNQMATRRAPT